MFNSAHLCLFVLNAVLPIFWVYAVIRDWKRYHEAVSEIKQEEARADALMESIEAVTEDASTDVMRRRQIILDNHKLFKLSCKTKLESLKLDLHIWISLAVLMIISSASNAIIVAVKVYHRECPCEFRTTVTATVQSPETANE